ncbi:MAG: YraN family protein [Candidatus Dormibacteraceae bacterium]
MGGGDRAAAALGAQGERWAAAFLRKRGWQIVGRGFRTPRGEIDLVCRCGGRLLMAEVKTRRSDRWGRPETAVGEVKQARLRRAAQDYRRLNAWRGEIAYGIVAITLRDDGRPQIELLEHAF